MRIKGNVRIDKTMPIMVDNNITINGIHIISSNTIKVTNELLHALVVDYAFHRLSRLDNIYSKYALISRRKTTRRIIHDADTMHKIIDSNYTCPLLSRGKPYSWNQEVYNFETNKFI